MKMEPTLDVMKDLMVVYLSGEASADTRALVEEYARSHPEYAALLRAASATGELETAPPAQDSEMRTLKMTRQFVFLRSLFLGMGIAFTFMPFTIVVRSGNIAFLLYRDVPALAVSFWSIAAASWVACYVMHREVRKAGL
jgi:hypothetical protein